MRRALAALLLAACCCAALGCGKYGPPLRAQKSPPVLDEEKSEEATP